MSLFFFTSSWCLVWIQDSSLFTLFSLHQKWKSSVQFIFILWMELHLSSKHISFLSSRLSTKCKLGSSSTNSCLTLSPRICQHLKSSTMNFGVVHLSPTLPRNSSRSCVETSKYKNTKKKKNGYYSLTLHSIISSWNSSELLYSLCFPGLSKHT